MKRTKHFISFFLCYLLLAASTIAAAAIKDKKPPHKVISINLCTDELAIELAKPNQLRSVSYISHDPQQSSYAKKAKQYPINRGLAEEIISLNPDLIISSQYSSAYTKSLLKRLNYSLIEIPNSNSIQGMYNNIKTIAKALGVSAKGEKLITILKNKIRHLAQKLKYIQRQKPKISVYRPRVLIYRIGGWMSKPPELIDELIEKVGAINIAREIKLSTWTQVSLEAIVRLKPDFIIFMHTDQTSFSLKRHHLSHPVFNYYKKNKRIIFIPSAWVNCGSPILIKAIARLQHKLYANNDLNENEANE